MQCNWQICEIVFLLQTMLFSLVSVSLCIVAYVVEAIHATPPQKMIMLPVEGAHAASCLDGSPYAFYIIPGNPKFFSIGLHGGGWCYDEADCAARAQALTLRSCALPRPLGQG